MHKQVHIYIVFQQRNMQAYDKKNKDVILRNIIHKEINVQKQYKFMKGV
ncbi:hypothetical protein KDI_43020 [Dictyobacter arantiisoli]|uniref:Uncharacterized protein n=1 Tax=Dictyobacter arantiisoli TaxID=2014874 RepID=A0A5A5THQ2_9CHLR|nr:hypothetical protein KDI_43020 [Dictyobacter arantiisoli]